MFLQKMLQVCMKIDLDISGISVKALQTEQSQTHVK